MVVAAELLRFSPFASLFRRQDQTPDNNRHFLENNFDSFQAEAGRIAIHEGLTREIAELVNMGFQELVDIYQQHGNVDQIFTILFDQENPPDCFYDFLCRLEPDNQKRLSLLDQIDNRSESRVKAYQEQVATGQTDIVNSLQYLDLNTSDLRLLTGHCRQLEELSLQTRLLNRFSRLFVFSSLGPANVSLPVGSLRNNLGYAKFMQALDSIDFNLTDLVFRRVRVMGESIEKLDQDLQAFAPQLEQKIVELKKIITEDVEEQRAKIVRDILSSRMVFLSPHAVIDMADAFYNYQSPQNDLLQRLEFLLMKAKGGARALVFSKPI